MQTSIEELLEKAIAAFNRGEVAHAHSIAGEVLASDQGNLDAGELLANTVRPEGEIRRLTVMFCDLVGSTEMSSRLEPETYRTIVARCQAICRSVIEQRYGGSIVSLKGDGILASFGFPVAHENDAERAVHAGLDLLAAVRPLTDDVARELGETVSLRVAVHKGVVFLDLTERDLYGFAVNVAARLEGLATPGTLLISDDVKRLVADRFDLEEHEPRAVKGVASPLVTYTVLGEHEGSTLRRFTGQLIGRDEELEALRDRWKRARDTEREPAECAAVVGDAGIGKSRLVAALVDAVEGDGGVVVEIAGAPLETGSGLWPIRRLIETRAGFFRGADSIERLHRLRLDMTLNGVSPDALPALATLLGIPPDAGYAPIQSDARRLREEIDDAAFDYLASCFAGSRGVFVCEDAHWFDQQTADLVKRATQKLGSEVLTVITSRETAAVPIGSLVTTINLRPLAPDDALELLRAMRAEGGQSHDVLLDIVLRGDGVPLYLEELYRASVQASSAAKSAQAADSVVPEVLYESLLSRLNVSTTGATVAAAAAAIGREVDVSLLSAVAELSPRDLDEALDALAASLILVPMNAVLDRYRFRHELLREVAYEMQPPTRRRELHGRIASALVVGVDEDAVEWQTVAVHYARALKAADAADAYEKASESARQRGALSEARSLLTEAIEQATGDPDSPPEREVGLRLQRGYLSLSMEGNSSPDAAGDYERCLELSLSAVGSGQMFATLISLWAYYSSRAEFDRAIQVLDLLHANDAALPPAMSAMIEGCYGLVAWYRGDYVQGRERYAVMQTMFENVVAGADLSSWWFIPTDPYVVSTTNTPLMVAMSWGDISSAESLLAKARALVADAQFPRGPYTLVAGMSFHSWWNVEIGNFDGASRIVDEIAEICARHGFDSWGVVAATQRQVFDGLRIVYEGRAAENQPALSALASTIGTYMSMWKMMEQWVFTTYYTTMQGVIHAAAGEPELAIAAFDEAQAIAARTGMAFYEAETRRHRANLGDTHAEKEAGLRDAMDLAEQQGIPLYELRSAMDLADLIGDDRVLAPVVEKFAAEISFADLERARARVNPA